MCVRRYSVMSDSLPPCGLQTVRLLWPWNLPGKNTGMSCCFLLQGNLPDPGRNPPVSLCLLHWQVGSLPLPHLGSPLFSGADGKNDVHLSILSLDKGNTPDFWFQFYPFSSLLRDAPLVWPTACESQQGTGSFQTQTDKGVHPSETAEVKGLTGWPLEIKQRKAFP